MKKPRKPWRLPGFSDRHLFRSLNLVAPLLTCRDRRPRLSICDLRVRVICCFLGVTRKATQYSATKVAEWIPTHAVTYMFVKNYKFLSVALSLKRGAAACSVRTAEAVRFKSHPRLAEGKQNEKSTHKGCFFVLGSVTDLDATKYKKSHRAAALCYIKSFLQNPHAPPSVQRSVRNAE